MPLVLLLMAFTLVRPEPSSVYEAEAPSCDYAFNATDEFTKATKIEMKSRHFFAHTEPELRKFMKEKDFLECSGYLTSMSGMTALNLEITLDSPYARDEYGAIQPGANLIIRLIDGETVTLMADRYAKGESDQRKGKTTYNNMYLIGTKDEKTLSKVEVDKVRMVWQVGYEDYEVYELDFFIDQLACIQAARNM